MIYSQQDRSEISKPCPSFQFPGGHLPRPFLIRPSKSWVVSLLPLNVCPDGFLQASWNELEVDGGLVRKWEEKREKEGLEPNEYFWNSWPGLPKGRVELEDFFFQCRFRVPKGASFPEIYVTSTFHLAWWSSFVLGIGSLRPKSHLFINGWILDPTRRSRNRIKAQEISSMAQ